MNGTGHLLQYQLASAQSSRQVLQLVSTIPAYYRIMSAKIGASLRYRHTHIKLRTMHY